MSTPIKRAEFLKQLSREHHHGLLLCWKIREGIKKNVAPERIKAYADWFWEEHLERHFKEEEDFIFPILPNTNENIKKAIDEHRSIKKLFQKKTDLINTLNRIQHELENHIRFEERILFNEIQDTASEEHLQKIKINHSEKFKDNLSDEFWK